MTSLPAVNRRVLLTSRPHGLPTPDVWSCDDAPVSPPGPGEVVIEVTHISLDPAMRGWIEDRRSYVEPVQLGGVMRAIAAGRVIVSNNDGLPPGTWVSGVLGAQRYAISDGSGLERIDPDEAPVARYLGALGMTGLTAYFGMIEIGRPKAGETVVVSGAAGAVGSVAAQIAKLLGCRTIGVAGGAEKCAWLVDGLGLDAAIDYKSEDVRRRLRELAPDGVDVYFDNVGGEVLEAALARLALHARIVYCGSISQYNATDAKGPRNYRSLLVNRASVTGLIVFDFAKRYPEARAQLKSWIDEGLIEAREQVVRGPIDDFPETFLSLFAGANRGKLVLELT